MWAAYNRPGVDPIGWPFMPSANYNNANVAAYDGGDNAKPDFKSLTNNAVTEIFDHNAVSMIYDWDMSDSAAIKYLFNYQQFTYFQPRQ